MFVKMKTFALSTLLVSGIAISAEEKGSVEAKAIMDGVYDSFVKVIPHVYGDSTLDLKNKKEKDELIKNLNDISDYFKSATHVKYFQRPGFRPSLDTINVHLQETINSAKADNVHFTKKRLGALTQLCISCHAQLSDSSNPNSFANLINKSDRSKFTSDYAYANYLFLIRNFEESKKYFDLSIKDSLNKGKLEQLNDSLLKALSINTMIDFNYKKAHAFLKKLDADKSLFPMTRSQVKSWMKSLESWKNFDFKKVKSLDQFIDSQVKDAHKAENEISLLVVNGVLTKFLVENPNTDQTPKILYWLGVTEKHLSKTYFYSLGDLYLKECIQLYPKTDYAKQCYNEYADNLEFGFSGSAGTDIPREEKQELERLKKLAN